MEPTNEWGFACISVHSMIIKGKTVILNVALYVVFAHHLDSVLDNIAHGLRVE